MKNREEKRIAVAGEIRKTIKKMKPLLKKAQKLSLNVEIITNSNELEAIISSTTVY